MTSVAGIDRMLRGSIILCPISAGAAFVQCMAAEVLPVCKLTRVGEQTDAGAYAEENRIPWAASFSRFGVSTIELFDHCRSGCIGTEVPFHA